jgi:transposase
LKKRVELTTLVLDQSLSIGKAAKITGIKLSTAKLIIKKYRSNGTYFESKEDKKKRFENKKTSFQASNQDF